MAHSTHQIIPARSGRTSSLWFHVSLATLAGLAVRLYFILHFPAEADDSKTYLQLARNWADHRIYGLFSNSKLIPTDLRLPGYPAYLAGVAMVLGRSQVAILLSQSALDLLTCYLTAFLAAGLVPVSGRRRVAIAGLWLAATCPFVANYSAVVLTEVLTTFLATAALTCFTLSFRRIPHEYSIGSFHIYPTADFLIVLGALFTGLASLVRPEMPLLIVVAAAVIALHQLKFFSWKKMLQIELAMAAAFLLPLLPWAARNFITLHEFQISAPRYATSSGEYAPTGFYAWTATWMSRYRDVYETVWKIGSEPIDKNSIPQSAFDSPEEKRQVISLIDRYNLSPNFDISPALDRQFRAVAENRTRRYPLRTYLWIRFQRSLTIWFTPRTELLPFDGKIWPIEARWENDPIDFSTTAFLAGLGYLYVALALAGIMHVLRRFRNQVKLPPTEAMNVWGIGLLIAYMVIRTAFLTTIEAPEPRYVITCYPAVLALAAMLWAKFGAEGSERRAILAADRAK